MPAFAVRAQRNRRRHFPGRGKWRGRPPSSWRPAAPRTRRRVAWLRAPSVDGAIATAPTRATADRRRPLPDTTAVRLGASDRWSSSGPVASRRVTEQPMLRAERGAPRPRVTPPPGWESGVWARVGQEPARRRTRSGGDGSSPWGGRSAPRRHLLPERTGPGPAVRIEARVDGALRPDGSAAAGACLAAGVRGRGAPGVPERAAVGRALPWWVGLHRWRPAGASACRWTDRVSTGRSPFHRAREATAAPCTTT